MTIWIGGAASAPSAAEIGEAGLLARFPRRDEPRIGLTGVEVATDLHPHLHVRMPAQQHPRVGGCTTSADGDVHRRRTRLHVARRQQRPQPFDVGPLVGVHRAIRLERTLEHLGSTHRAPPHFTVPILGLPLVLYLQQPAYQRREITVLSVIVSRSAPPGNRRE